MIILRKVALTLSLGIWVAAASAQQSPSILPFEPAQLLAVLPTAPPDWKVMRSQGDTALNEWLEARASRTLKAPVVVPNPADPAPTPQGEIEITVVDTAGFAPSLAAFANFTPSKTGNFEKKLLGALPSIIVTNENGRQFAQVLVSGRYIVELTLVNLPKHRLEDWLRAFHFETLPRQNKALEYRPREFRLVHVDELEPKNNRSYAVSTTNSKKVDAFLKTLPPTPPEPVVAGTVANKQP